MTAQRAIPWLGVGLGLALLWGHAVPAAQHPMEVSWYSFDYFNYFLPKFVHGSEELTNGRLPLWNPYEGLGQPLLGALQPAAFYPPKIAAYALPDADLATRVFLIAHFLGLGAGFLWLARSRGIGAVGAFAGAVWWTFNIPILLSNHHPNRIADVVWLPFVFALAERAAKGSLRAWSVLGAVVGIMLLAGYPIFVSDASLMLGAVAVASWISGDWRASPLRSLPLCGSAFVFGGLLACAMLVPAFASLPETGRTATAAFQSSGVDPLSSGLAFRMIGMPSAQPSASPRASSAA